jgi:hypothetical protein
MLQEPRAQDKGGPAELRRRSRGRRSVARCGTRPRTFRRLHAMMLCIDALFPLPLPPFPFLCNALGSCPSPCAVTRWPSNQMGALAELLGFGLLVCASLELPRTSDSRG